MGGRKASHSIPLIERFDMRLQMLLESTRSIPEEKFDMGTFYDGVDPRRPEGLHNCGTSGCLIGWATIRDEQLHALLLDVWFRDGYHITKAAKAFAKYYGITEKESLNVFFNSYQTLDEAILKIEALIEKQEAGSRKHHSNLERETCK